MNSNYTIIEKRILRTAGIKNNDILDIFKRNNISSIYSIQLQECVPLNMESIKEYGKNKKLLIDATKICKQDGTNKIKNIPFNINIEKVKDKTKGKEYNFKFPSIDLGRNSLLESNVPYKTLWRANALKNIGPIVKKFDNVCFVDSKPVNELFKKFDVFDNKSFNALLKIGDKDEELREYLEELTKSMKYIKSLDIHVNLDALTNLIDSFKKCDKRFVIAPVSLKTLEKNKPISHANYLVYDGKKKTLSLIDPFGDEIFFEMRNNYIDLISQLSNSDIIDKSSCNYLAVKSLETNWVNLVKSLPKETVNSIPLFKNEPTLYNFCTLWTVLGMLTRLANPNMSDDDIAKNLSNYLNSNKLKAPIEFSKILPLLVFV